MKLRAEPIRHDVRAVGPNSGLDGFFEAPELAQVWLARLSMEQPIVIATPNTVRGGPRRAPS